ncbi:hypothetical protein RSOLAG1IB_08740 [Rhizoctonia solani AG-1 IB]|uniref:Laminin domain protein n=1 Tax=Thanatephorus cucumeris (strain AG1-IB / isolate 7/3/14) TaxID=1108050 RepID=A0A0B7FL47_THACB|nr:hypothetical protein RSOLAG1IB_08740 [Rhizoctonia solani AG-1 IB]
MTIYSTGPVCSPPDLPPYLKGVRDLKPIFGLAKDHETIGIHAVIRMAEQAVDIPGTGDHLLIARLYEHLFDIQMAKYRNRCFNTTFPEDSTYVPPPLPVHVAVQLEPVTGSPSEEEVIKVQTAVRTYRQFANAPSLFDPHVDMDLSQHLFDIQMARYTQRARQNYVGSKSDETLITNSVTILQQTIDEQQGASINNAGTGANVGSHELVQPIFGSGIQDKIEQSNRLAEQANQLIERSNQITERTNQLIEESTRLVDQSVKPVERFNQLFERLNEHLEQSNLLAKESMRPVDRLGDTLKNINRVLMRIQHAIVRNHRGNTISAFDCLVNEKGETPATSITTEYRRFEDVASGKDFIVTIDGIPKHHCFDDAWLGRFIRFYGIGDDMFDGASAVELKAGVHERHARVRLRKFLGSCLG